jgi:hypothetical protein
MLIHAKFTFSNKAQKSTYLKTILLQAMNAVYLVSEGILIYTIDGIIDQSTMHELEKVKAEISKGQALRIMAFVPEFSGYKSLKAAKTALLFDLKILPELTHYALVTDFTWLKNTMRFSIFIPKVSFRYFGLKNKDEAMGWLRRLGDERRLKS